MKYKALLPVLIIAILFTSVPVTAAPQPVTAPADYIDPTARLDESINIEKFPSRGNFIIHFNTPMSPESSPQPVLTWPDVPGSGQWDETRLTFTFTPDSFMENGKEFNFFLDPELTSMSGKRISTPMEWMVRVNRGPSVERVWPAGGELNVRNANVEVYFDTPMKPATSPDILTITPAVPFELAWKDKQTLLINLAEPFKSGHRYELALHRGDALLDEFSTPLKEDYHWSYNLQAVKTKVSVEDAITVRLNFNKRIRWDSINLPFSISPELPGVWSTEEPYEAVFTSYIKIPSLETYKVSITQPLTAVDGSVLSEFPEITFSGNPPLHINEEKSGISMDHYGSWHADQITDRIAIDFEKPVDHASAEKSFSLSPAVPGKFQWEKDESFPGETMVFILDGALEPGKSYTLSIQPSLSDTNGKALAARSFEAIIYSYNGGYRDFTFGERGDDIQLIDAAGTRMLEFSAPDEENLTFSAYAFTPETYVDLYNKYYQYRGYSSYPKDIPMPAGSKPAAQWKNISRIELEFYSEKINRQLTQLPEELPAGLYIVTMLNKNRIMDQLFVVITHNNLNLKYNDNDVDVWMSGMDGKSVPGAAITIFDKEGKTLAEGVTDKDGFYKATLNVGDKPNLVTGQLKSSGQPGDITLCGFSDWGTDIPYDNFSYWYLPTGEPYRTYIYTDRPIYRPGQTVNYKIIVRKDNDMRYELPDPKIPVKVEVSDGRSNSIQQMELTTDEFGTANGSFTLSKEGMLGSYSIHADVDGVKSNLGFVVEDYRKPDYQVTLTSLQPEKNGNFVKGEDVKFLAHASYYFGEPLANSPVSYKVWGNFESTEGNATTDNNGDAIITFKATGEFYNDSYQINTLVVTVDDGSHQKSSVESGIRVYSANGQLTLDIDGYYFSPGEEFPVKISAEDLTGKPLQGKNLNLSIYSWNWEKHESEDAPIRMFGLTTDASGKASQSFSLPAGYHRLELSGTDENGNQLEATDWVYVFTKDSPWHGRSKARDLQISTNKRTYQQDEKARLLIESTFSGPALLTFERGSVISRKMIELTAPLTIVETEIMAEYAPNVYVVVNAWQKNGDAVNRSDYAYYSTRADSYLRAARTEIRVESRLKALDISITPDKKVYAPGDTVKTTLQVKDSSGAPVQAELSLAVVDEAIFALKPDNSANIFDEFYGPRRHSVSSSNSMSPSRELSVGGNGGGGGDITDTQIRSDFQDTSTWLPVIKTDANGRAEVEFKLPDNTTSWRLSAKAISQDHRVGQALTNIETKKDIFLRTALPRVLTQGDTANIRVFLHNTGDTKRSVKVSLDARGLELQGGNQKDITILPETVVPLTWPVKVTGAISTEVKVTAKNAQGNLDVLILPLLLQPANAHDVQNISGQFTGNVELPLAVPGINPDTSRISLSINRSMSGTVLNGLEFLTGYPYGCVEQTMSKAMPNAVVVNAAEKLSIGQAGFKESLDPLVNDGINKLLGMQHQDGGWGWWLDDDTDLYQTAWVLFGLGIMKDSGYSFDPNVMKRAADLLNYSLEHKNGDEPTTAFELFSLAESGNGDLETTKEFAAESLANLDPFSQAALAMAFDRLGEKKEAMAILDTLSKSAVHSGEQVYWPTSNMDGEYHRKTMSSTIRTTAFVLLAYSRLDHQNPLATGAFQYLKGHRQGLEGWGTTNETSYTILALTEYLLAVEASVEDTPFEVLVNSEKLTAGILTKEEPGINVIIPIEKVKNGRNSIVIKTEAKSPVYYDLSTAYDLVNSKLTPGGTVSVSRRYLDPKTSREITEIKAGELVKVEVTVTSPQCFYLAVEDYLPGGLEALNEGLNSQNRVLMEAGFGAMDYFYNTFYWEEYGYNYKEIRGDRVVFFITNKHDGVSTYTYYTRATTTGEFTALPARAYAMYSPDLQGHSEGTLFIVR